MISFENFTIENGSPIYAQIVSHVKGQIASGGVKHQEEMPSRRVLSALLGVNPNTVQKAYRILEEEGVIESRSGAKSCVVADEEAMKRIRRELLEKEAGKMIGQMKRAGLSKKETICLIESLWDREGAAKTEEEEG